MNKTRTGSLINTDVVMHSSNEEKELNKALRLLFKNQDQSQLTQEAFDACKVLGIKPESLILRQADSFGRI